MRSFSYLFLVALVVIIWKYFSKKIAKVPRQTERKLSPLKIAIGDLKIARRNIGKNSSRAFISLLIAAIRHYLSVKFKYIDGAKTSDEILAKLTHDITNNWKISSLATEIFSLSDRVNFAKRELTVAQQRGIYKKACKLILEISRSRKKFSPCK
ncbi:MAG: hypothetical protein LBB15_00815 [Puniceicoccales bacterium]|jgi:hypothetical protein|nr:hypothetical protein [Puniceicoccales bacterium]